MAALPQPRHLPFHLASSWWLCETWEQTLTSWKSPQYPELIHTWSPLEPQPIREPGGSRASPSNRGSFARPDAPRPKTNGRIRLMSNDMQIPEAWFDLPPDSQHHGPCQPSVSSGMYVHSKDCRLTTGRRRGLLQGLVHWMGHEPLAVEGGNAWQPPASSGGVSLHPHWLRLAWGAAVEREGFTKWLRRRGLHVTRRGLGNRSRMLRSQHEPTWPPRPVKTGEARPKEPRSRYSADARSNGKGYVTHLGPSLSSDPIPHPRGRVGDSVWLLIRPLRGNEPLLQCLSHWAEDARRHSLRSAQSCHDSPGRTRYSGKHLARTRAIVPSIARAGTGSPGALPRPDAAQATRHTRTVQLSPFPIPVIWTWWYCREPHDMFPILDLNQAQVRAELCKGLLTGRVVGAAEVPLHQPSPSLASLPRTPN